MAKFLTFLFAGLLSLIPTLVKKALVSLGIGTITYTGVKVLLDSLTNQMYSYVGQIASDVLAVMNLAGFSDCLSILVSAVSARLAFRMGVSGDTLKKWVVR